MTGFGATPQRREWKWRRDFVSDVFHTISQPLTAVQLSLELALKKKDVEQQRTAIRDALVTTKRAIESARFVRLLADAEDPGDIAAVDLHRVLSQVTEEMQPVAHAQGARIFYLGKWPAWVNADETRLGQALFLLTDMALRNCRGSNLRLELRVMKRSALVSAVNEDGDRRKRNREKALVPFDQEERAMLLARTIIRSARGIVEHWVDGRYHCWLVRIPLAKAPNSSNQHCQGE